MSIKVSNIHKPTPAFWVKVALSCTSISTAIGSYGLVASSPIFIYIGGGALIIGNTLPHFFAEDSKPEDGKQG